MKRHLVIARVVLILAGPGLTLSAGCSVPSPDYGSKAAIIDQLAIMKPNQVFLDQMTAQLEACGFEVEIYQGEKVNVMLWNCLDTDIS